MSVEMWIVAVWGICSLGVAICCIFGTIDDGRLTVRDLIMDVWLVLCGPVSVALLVGLVVYELRDKMLWSRKRPGDE